MKTAHGKVLPAGDRANTEVACQTLVEVAGSNPAIWVLTADVMHSTKLEPFALAYPDRFVNIGIAEQTMIGVAAGLATCGKIPFAAAFAPMLTMRACEQIRTDLAYPNLDVKLIATHSGFALGTGGTTHHATEDIALMRSLANMTVLVPCDERETRESVLAAVARRGPVYIRLGRAARDPVVHGQGLKYRIGSAIELRRGRDIALIACGRTVAECLMAADLLSAEGVDACVLDMHTVKPIDREAIAQAATTRIIFTVEEHSVVGGLGGAVAEVLTELDHAVPLQRLGVPDIFAAVGSQDELMEKYGLTSQRIAGTVLRVLHDRRL